MIKRYLEKMKKKIGDTDTKNILPGYMNRIWHLKMFIIKSREIENAERIKLPNKKSIRTLREKENYKYLGIVEADSMKQA